MDIFDTQPKILAISLRDYFAAQAMQVFIANDETDMDQDVRDAYMLADKMLAERSKT
jgi:hypothetical protein